MQSSSSSSSSSVFDPTTFKTQLFVNISKSATTSRCNLVVDVDDVGDGHRSIPITDRMLTRDFRSVLFDSASGFGREEQDVHKKVLGFEAVGCQTTRTETVNETELALRNRKFKTETKTEIPPVKIVAIPEATTAANNAVQGVTMLSAVLASAGAVALCDA